MTASSRKRMVLLLTALGLIVFSIALFQFLAYADAHKFDQGFDWLSSGLMRPAAIVMSTVFLLGLALAAVSLLQREER